MQRFADERGTGGPLAPDAERGDETEDEQKPPRIREIDRSGEDRVGEDGQRERSSAAELVAYAAEDRAADGPTHEEHRLDQDRLGADVFGIGRDAVLLGQNSLDERRGEDDKEIAVEAIEGPAEPRGDQRLGGRSGTDLHRQRLHKVRAGIQTPGGGVSIRLRAFRARP